MLKWHWHEQSFTIKLSSFKVNSYIFIDVKMLWRRTINDRKQVNWSAAPRDTNLLLW